MTTNKNMLLLLLTLSLLTSCAKNESECELIPAKVIRYDCDRVIFQLLTTQTIGDMNWKDNQTGQYYDNAVSYDNTCEIAELTNGEFVTLFVKPVKTGSGQQHPNCVQCMAISDAPPVSWVKFTAIEKVACSTNQ